MTRKVVWSRDVLDDVKAQLAYVAAALGRTPTGRPGRVAGIYEKSVGKLP